MKIVIIFLLMLLTLNAKENKETNSTQYIGSKNLATPSKVSDKLDIKKLKSNKVYIQGNSKLEKQCSPKDRLNLVHIVKKVDNMTVEYWVDPYADNVNIDLQFTNKVSENKKDISTTVADNTKDDNSSVVDNKELDKSSKLMDSYLSNYENAHAYFYKKKYNKAHFYIDRAIAINSKVSYGYRFQGTIYYAEKNYEKALEAWKRAVELNPSLEDVKQYIHKLESN